MKDSTRLRTYDGLIYPNADQPMGPCRRPTREQAQSWYETRSGLLDRFCDLDTADWGENEFFHFLEKPWKSDYEIPIDTVEKGD